MRARERVLVLEEGGPFVEEGLRDLASRLGVDVHIHGRHDRAVPEEDELTAEAIGGALMHLDERLSVAPAGEDAPDLHAEQPLCDDCPYWPILETLQDAVAAHGGRQEHVIIGEPGCMVRAVQPPLEVLDVKYSMGSGPGLALGLALAQDQRHVIALLGDSSFLHSGLNAMPQIAQNAPRMLMLVLENGTTALTGGQPHAATPLDERGRPRATADLAAIMRGFGFNPQVCAAENRAELRVLLDEALESHSPRVIIARGVCPRYLQGSGRAPDQEQPT
jgi:indolepyruvate ferredoxin oxidoreductase alpha subunit